ncbi:unnamed protein product [Adineta ricciae]|uniref:mannan endo-1,4-beta-mannosidase n=1 Tax=Adineta ricciae TaxID=249248 RepID=A0A814NGD0_ADIRI|nr:unnamed protein product [Adineta ricciae]
MMFYITIFFVLCIRLTQQATSSFINVQNRRLTLNGQDYLYVGTNFWYGANLGSTGPGGNRTRLLRELDHLHSLGVDNLRIQAGSEGPNTEPWRIVPSMQPDPGRYDENVLEGLDFLLYEMGQRNMRAVMCLNNFWHWSGGYAQYIVWAGGANSIPYPGDYDAFERFSARFYELPAAVQLFNNHIQFIMKRTNKYNNLPYVEDATIMSWELANEPRRLNLSWVNATACSIKQLAPKQLVTTGVEGNISSNNFSNDHASPCIDYATFHLWVQNWNIYDPKNASDTFPSALEFARKYIEYHVAYKEKPVVLEEFGISRDNDDHSATAPITIRDKYYQAIFQWARAYRIPVNFWAYGGEGRPRLPRANWTQGDDFIGDPPHEPQGWYSVYDTDESTLEIIHRFASGFLFSFHLKAMNLTQLTIDPSLIVWNISTIVLTTLGIVLATLFLITILIDKKSKKNPIMVLVANSCLSSIVFGIDMLVCFLIALNNDLKEIRTEDSLCKLRAYIAYSACGVFDYSFFVQALYRYNAIIHPKRTNWQSLQNQLVIIASTWILGFLVPSVFLFTTEIVYNIDNQVCQIPLRISTSSIYLSFCIYLIPLLLITGMYLKLIRHVKRKRIRIIQTRMFIRAQRELEIVKRILIHVFILMGVGCVYASLLFISIFRDLPKYHFRIAYIFGSTSFLFVMISIFQFNPLLKQSIINKLLHK